MQIIVMHMMTFKTHFIEYYTYAAIYFHKSGFYRHAWVIT